jgi:hypothetical protein
MNKVLLFVFFLINSLVLAQTDHFPYTIEINPVEISGFPGLHSFAFAQHEGKWLIIGGRSDGLHARQPNASFPANSNNTEIFVVDELSKTFWFTSVNSLAINLKEQLQSTNMNFHQDGTTLYIIGGYAFSASKGNHITFPFLTAIDAPGLIDAIINEKSINPFFIQVEDERMAVTGGQLAKFEDTFFLVGGHRFDGRYNPMGGPSFTQSYTNQIRKFKIAPNIGPLAISDYEAITDPIHLRRRDYNLVPQIFPDGTEGYMISSGVFQIDADLPFLYPVDITREGYIPRTEFNQFLSNYHGPKIAIHDRENNQTHAIFFGGMSQYYYENNELIQDNRVPFTKGISRVTRYENNGFVEYPLPIEMPDLQGASAEFIPNLSLPMYSNKVVKINEIKQEEILLGHIVGGIFSQSRNPFSDNQVSNTRADNTIYSVKLIKSPITSIPKIDGSNPFEIFIFPNPVQKDFMIRYHLDQISTTRYYLINSNGSIMLEGKFENQNIGKNEVRLKLPENTPTQILFLTLCFDEKYYVSKKLIIEDDL